VKLSERVSLWYSDNIYADELIRNGIKHALVKNSVVKHLGSATINYSVYATDSDYIKYIEGYRVYKQLSKL